ncbi:MAG: DUF4838 domain-containing protein, partial [Planctomycetes bacterium]|nr:DUF4838 domain-containing protein [Planctomycetota bacterium]
MKRRTDYNGNRDGGRSSGRFWWKVGGAAWVIWVAAAGVGRAGLYPEMKPPWTVWVKEGRPVATIVCTPPKSGTNPAEELNGWLKRITGTRLPVRTEPPANGPRVWLGGRGAWRRLQTSADALKLGPDGYVIRSVGDDLVIAGATNLGTLFGVSAFLEHYLGCRWFWPSETGIVVPKTRTLRVGRIDEVSRPDFAIRWIMRDAACARFNRLNVAVNEPDEFRIRWFVHTWCSLVPPARYWKEHPEYYAEAGGRRVDPTRPHVRVNLCTTNPDVVAAAVKTIDEQLAADPSIDMISVDPEDTQQFCDCPNCRKLRDPDAPYPARNTRLVFDFTKRIAERVRRRHPKLLIKTIAYHTYLAPPPFELPDNVVVQFCRFTCHNHFLGDPACPDNRYFNRYALGWSKVCRRIMFYEYYYKASWCGLPWPIVHMLRRDLPYLRQHGVVGVASQWSGNHANNGLGFYVASKLLWNVDLDVDLLLDDFYKKAYAEAAGPMRRYHERLERAMAESGLHVAQQRAFRQMWKLFTPELLRALRSDLAEAKRVVVDPGAAARVRLMENGLRYTELVADYLNTVARFVEKPGSQRWIGSASAVDMKAVAAACEPKVKAIEAFIRSPEGRYATAGLGPYVQRLLDSQTVAQSWYDPGDLARGRTLTKTQWLETHTQRFLKEPPSRAALWVYGNDLDWNRADGPEHRILARGRNGQSVLLGTLARPDRQGNRVNRAFIIRHIELDRLDTNRMVVTIENPPGGPTGSRIFAVYLMPDDQTSEDEATRLIEAEPKTVRRR